MNGKVPPKLASPERRAAVCNALRGLIQVSVDLDPDGSRIMVYEPNDVDEPDDYEPFGNPPSDENR